MYTNITLLLTLQSWHKGDCTASARRHTLWQTAQSECHPVAYLKNVTLFAEYEVFSQSQCA